MEEGRKRWMEDITKWTGLKFSAAVTVRLCELPKTNAGDIHLMFTANPSGGWYSSVCCIKVPISSKPIDEIIMWVYIRGRQKLMATKYQFCRH